MEDERGFFIVSDDQTGERLDKLLSTHFYNHSRSYFQYLIENGCVLVNGEKLKKRDKLKSGDEVEICFLLTPELSLEPENIPLEILYEDDHLLAINKPPHMVVHPAPGNPSHTFVNALLHHCKGLPIGSDRLRPGIVHRLDKETSGVLLAAKTSTAHCRLVDLFAQRKIEKHYLVICIGNPCETVIDEPIKRHPVQRKMMAVDPSGKPAITHFAPIEVKEGLCLAAVRLMTGRTHQIRVHLKHNGTPVLGDSLYGSLAMNKKWEAKRQLLHARRLVFSHPVTDQLLDISAPVPNDFLKFFNRSLDYTQTT